MLKINNTEISSENPPYIIAELSANHGGSIDRAKNSILAAKNSGANAVKLQTYTPDTMTLNSNKPDFKINDGLWSGYTLYDLYRKAYTPYEWHEELFNYAKEIGITIFSTPFDETAIDLLERLDSPAYKIASFEIIDLELIRLAAQTGKPVLISTGMASLSEISDAVEAVRSVGNNQILLFHCVSSYPAITETSNLNNIIHLSKEFGTQVGLSDHTQTNIASTVAISLGACAIEKHFKFDSEDCGPDASFSLLPDELSSLVVDTHAAWKSLGLKQFTRPDIEAPNKVFRRSLYFVSNLKEGSKITEKDIRRIRPGYGLPPKFFNDVIGKTINQDIEIGDPVSWELLK